MNRRRTESELSVKESFEGFHFKLLAFDNMSFSEQTSTNTYNGKIQSYSFKTKESNLWCV